MRLKYIRDKYKVPAYRGQRIRFNNGCGDVFGKAMLEQELSNAEQAVMSGDVMKMIAAYQNLKECE